jgi:hypothetical protein
MTGSSARAAAGIGGTDVSDEEEDGGRSRRKHWGSFTTVEQVIGGRRRRRSWSRGWRRLGRGDHWGRLFDPMLRRRWNRRRLDGVSADLGRRLTVGLGRLRRSELVCWNAGQNGDRHRRAWRRRYRDCGGWNGTHFGEGGAQNGCSAHVRGRRRRWLMFSDSYPRNLRPPAVHARVHSEEGGRRYAPQDENGSEDDFCRRALAARKCLILQLWLHLWPRQPSVQGF